ncbi:hypothetical protein WJX74_000508 [Apatococcus lobatus]|uniref:Selenide, water dikinase n=1 Tax=Apatococcus lobatus TaxID=904363 RepID=A0AAW1RPF8_9CHLO
MMSAERLQDPRLQAQAWSLVQSLAAVRQAGHQFPKRKRLWTGHPARESLAHMLGTPLLKDLVLLGGGHSHVEVLRSFGMQPMPGVRLTLITRDIHTPYSGMLPGYVAGHYDYDSCHVDLAKLTAFAQARLINAEAIGIDTKSRRVELKGRPAFAYDVLSIDIGITPSSATPGAVSLAVPVKPIFSFVDHFHKLMMRAQNSTHPLKVVVVGGGAGGVELSLALHYRLGLDCPAAGHEVMVISRGTLLPGHVSTARRKFLRIMKEKGMKVMEQIGVSEVNPGLLSLEDGRQVAFDECLWCTEAAAAPWLRQTPGLPTDDLGFISVNDYLQSDGGPPEVFACGDVSSSTSHPRPKAGVYAVRAGPPLTQNLRRYLKGEPLQPYLPQSSNLSLISTGNRYAVGDKGWLCLEGGWLYNVKDWIDSKWMAKYGADLPDTGGMAMQGDSSKQGPAGSEVAAATGPEAIALLANGKMRCGGCGSKVGSTALSRALDRLKEQASNDSNMQAALAELDTSDDAALIPAPPAGHALVQSIDFFRAIVNDPFVFGAIAANHALSDCHAMGAQASAALVLAVVPHATEQQQEEELFQMLAGAAGILGQAGCRLLGGHSSEGTDPAFGLSITGYGKPDKLLRKGGLQKGQALVLTKALGTGVLMAAAMRGKAKGRCILGACNSMQQSNAAAAACLAKHGATGCTDITGFGLLGHLAEMAKASKVCVELGMADVPELQGAGECLSAGITSTLNPSNVRAAAAVTSNLPSDSHILTDPQTAGGLLAGIPESQAVACVSELRSLGYQEACSIGKTCSSLEPPLLIELKS